MTHLLLALTCRNIDLNREEGGAEGVLAMVGGWGGRWGRRHFGHCSKTGEGGILKSLKILGLIDSGSYQIVTSG